MLVVPLFLSPCVDWSQPGLIIIFLIMTSRCFVRENTHLLISALPQSDLLAYNDAYEGEEGLVCQRLAVKFSHLSVHMYVCVCV